MPEAMKIRAELKQGYTEVRVLMFHPMETGQRKDATGKVVPAQYIKTISASLNGRIVFEGQLSQAISRNPIFGFRVKGATAGEKIVITWSDSHGNQRTDEAVVSVAK